MEKFRLEKDGPSEKQSSEVKRIPHHGRTVFGIVSRAIRPRRCGCHRDYLRVCRQRRVEFGASSSLELFFFFGCSCFCCSLRFVCASGNLSRLSRVLYISFVSFSRLISRRKLTAACTRYRSHRRFTGETIAEIGKEALKTIDWSTQTPTR